MITVIAKKTLICDQGIECFTKGKEYEPSMMDLGLTEFKENTPLINNQRIQHMPGPWFKHFKLKK